MSIKPVTAGKVPDNAFGYFGTYSIDSVNSVVTRHGKGGSELDYTALTSFVILPPRETLYSLVTPILKLGKEF